MESSPPTPSPSASKTDEGNHNGSNSSNSSSSSSDCGDGGGGAGNNVNAKEEEPWGTSDVAPPGEASSIVAEHGEAVSVEVDGGAVPAASAAEPLRTSDPFVLSPDNDPHTGPHNNLSADTHGGDNAKVDSDAVRQGPPSSSSAAAADAIPLSEQPLPQPAMEEGAREAGGSATPPCLIPAESPLQHGLVQQASTPSPPLPTIAEGGVGDGADTAVVPTVSHVRNTPTATTTAPADPRRPTLERKKARSRRASTSLAALDTLLDAPSHTEQEVMLKAVVRQMANLIDLLERELCETRAEQGGRSSARGNNSHHAQQPRPGHHHQRASPRCRSRSARGEDRLVPERCREAGATTHAASARQLREKRSKERPTRTRASSATKPPRYMEMTYTVSQHYRYPVSPPPRHPHGSEATAAAAVARKDEDPPSLSPQRQRRASREPQARLSRPPPTKGREPTLRTASRAEERAKHEAEARANSLGGSGEAAASGGTKKVAATRTASRARSGSRGLASARKADEDRPTSRPRSSPQSKPPGSRAPCSGRARAHPTREEGRGSGGPAGERSSPSPSARRAVSKPRDAAAPAAPPHPQKAKRRAATKPLPLHLHTADRAAARPAQHERQSEEAMATRATTTKAAGATADFADLEANYWAQSNMVLQQLEKMLNEEEQ